MSNYPSQAGFRRAMDLVQEEFLQRLNFYQHSWLPARALVEEALAQRFKVDLGGIALGPGMVLTIWSAGLLLCPNILATLASLSGRFKWGDCRTCKRWVPLEGAPIPPRI